MNVKYVNIIKYSDYDRLSALCEGGIGQKFLDCFIEYLHCDDDPNSQLKWYKKWFIISDFVELYDSKDGNMSNIKIDSIRHTIKEFLNTFDDNLSCGKSDMDSNQYKLPNWETDGLTIYKILMDYYLDPQILDAIPMVKPKDKRQKKSTYSRIKSKLTK